MKLKYIRLLNKIGALITAVSMLAITAPVHAASLSTISDTMTRLKISTVSDHTIKFRVATAVNANSDTITITFPAEFTIGSVDYTDIDLSHGASTGAETEETLAAAAGAGTWGAVFSGQVLTLTAPTDAGATEIPANDYVIVEIGLNATGGNAQITNPASKGTYVVAIAGTFGDTGKFAVSIPEASGDDQIPVTATVNPSITFTVVNTALALGDLSPSSVTQSTINDLTVGTNATGGYTIKVLDVGGTGNGNPGLYESVSTALIASATGTLSAGTEGYGGQCEVHAGTGTCGFAATGGNAVTGFSDNTWGTFASHGSKPSGNETYHITVKAAISTSTTAGVYADTLTLVATGNF